MIKLIHARTGGELWVHESRLDEYLAAGHKIAPPPKPPVNSAPAPEKKKTVKKR